jgi:hypothetical protein
VRRVGSLGRNAQTKEKQTPPRSTSGYLNFQLFFNCCISATYFLQHSWLLIDRNWLPYDISDGFYFVAFSDGFLELDIIDKILCLGIFQRSYRKSTRFSKSLTRSCNLRIDSSSICLSRTSTVIYTS